MANYFIYVKRNAPEHWDNLRKIMIPQDKQFRAINSNGVRVHKLTEAIPFATKEDAVEWMEEKINKKGLQKEVQWEVRKKA